VLFTQNSRPFSITTLLCPENARPNSPSTVTQPVPTTILSTALPLNTQNPRKIRKRGVFCFLILRALRDLSVCRRTSRGISLTLAA